MQYQPKPERLKDTLKTLLLIDSPTGDTEEMERFMIAKLSEYGLNIKRTARGNIQAFVGEGEPKRAIAAHIDTLGAMVQSILPNGRLELAPLGHWSSRFAEGARVTLKTDHEAIRGTILPKNSSGHAYNTAVDTQPVAWSQVELRIDKMTSSAQETYAIGIRPGDIVTIDPQPEFTESGFLVSRFLDNKAAVACFIELLELLKEQNKPLDIPLMLIFTNAEEVGLGAGTALLPSVDELVSVDIAPVAANQSGYENRAVIGFKDELGPHSRVLLKQLDHLAKSNCIAADRDVFRFYHSDCSSALKAGHDVRSALLGFGTDSTHGYERTHIDSLVAVTQLLLAYVNSEMKHWDENS